jgi:hypothetical protein
MTLAEQYLKMCETTTNGGHVRALRQHGSDLNLETMIWLKGVLDSSDSGTHNHGIAVLGLIPTDRYEELIRSESSGSRRWFGELLRKYRDIAAKQRTGHNKWASIYK